MTMLTDQNITNIETIVFIVTDPKRCPLGMPCHGKDMWRSTSVGKRKREGKIRARTFMAVPLSLLFIAEKNGQGRVSWLGTG